MNSNLEKNHSKKSITPHWTPELYTRVFAPAYDFLTTISGWRNQLRKHGLADLPLGKLLDVGCGTGYFLNLAKQKNYIVAGIEPSQGMARKARILYGFDAETIHSTQGDRIPFPDAHFDIITANGSLVHIESIATTAKEICRVLKPGGRLRIIDHATPIRKLPMYPIVTLFSHGTGDIIHDYPSVFGSYCQLLERKTLGRGGYLQRFDFEKF